MATIGEEGGVATTASAPSATEQISYEDLYARWEKGNWRATDLDFSVDREHWHERFSEIERRGALWNYALFFHGEDLVADALSPYIDAAPREEQKYFLATQQVDEARHSVFFGRFMREVVEAGDSLQSSLAATKGELTWGFRRTFKRLEQMADELRRDQSKPKLAAAIALYHIVIEATLAQPGQHFIQSYLEDRDLMPGFQQGMRNVSLDEQRHIGFGVKMLSDLIAEDPECKDSIADLLAEVTPYTAAVFIPPNWDLRYVECFGSTIEEVYEHGAISFESKMKAVGMPVEEIPGLAYPYDLPPRGRAERMVALCRAGVLGPPNGPAARDPETMELVFDTVRRAVDPRHAPDRPTAIQWDFSDAEPWYLNVANGSTEAVQGRHASPDVTLRCRYDDWVDVLGSRADPRRLMVTGRLRPRGKLRALWSMRRLFPG